METTLGVLTTWRDRRDAHRQWPDQTNARNAHLVSESLRPDVMVNEAAERYGLKANHLSSWHALARQDKLVLPEPEGPIEFAAMVVECPRQSRLRSKRTTVVTKPVDLRQ